MQLFLGGSLMDRKETAREEDLCSPCDLALPLILSLRKYEIILKLSEL